MLLTDLNIPESKASAHFIASSLHRGGHGRTQVLSQGGKSHFYNALAEPCGVPRYFCCKANDVL